MLYGRLVRQIINEELGCKRVVNIIILLAAVALSKGSSLLGILNCSLHWIFNDLQVLAFAFLIKDLELLQAGREVFR